MNPLNTSVTLCNDTIHGSLISSLSVGFNMHQIKINMGNIEEDSNPSTLNNWIASNNGYMLNNQLIGGGAFVDNLDSSRITFIGVKTKEELDLQSLRDMVLGGSYLIVGNMLGRERERFVCLVGVGKNDVLVGRDPLYGEMRFSYSQQLGDEIWVYKIS